MPLEVTCLAYAGLAHVARSSTRYRRKGARIWSVDGWAGRFAGIALLLVSFAIAIGRLGPRLGPLTWLGLSMLSGVALVLLLSRSPRIAFGSVPLLLVAAVAARFWA